MLETKVNTVKGAKVSNPLNDLVKDSVKEVIKTPEQIKEEILKLQSLLPVKTVKPTPLYVTNKREYNKTCYNDLLEFGKVQRRVNADFKEHGTDFILSFCSSAQVDKLNQRQLEIGLKSKTVLLKVCSVKVLVNSLTPNQYINYLIKCATLRSETFEKRRK